MSLLCLRASCKESCVNVTMYDISAAILGSRLCSCIRARPIARTFVTNNITVDSRHIDRGVEAIDEGTLQAARGGSSAPLVGESLLLYIYIILFIAWICYYFGDYRRKQPYAVNCTEQVDPATFKRYAPGYRVWCAHVGHCPHVGSANTYLQYDYYFLNALIHSK